MPKLHNVQNENDPGPASRSCCELPHTPVSVSQTLGCPGTGRRHLVSSFFPPLSQSKILIVSCKPRLLTTLYVTRQDRHCSG